MLPEAHISHRAGERLRLKIPSRKGDAAYFSLLREELSKGAFKDVEANPLTGSVLLFGEDLDSETLADLGSKSQLFHLRARDGRPIPLSRKISAPIEELSQAVRRFTGGEADLAGIALVGLLTVGIYQIVRGDFRAPPWDTAFWYALGVFSMSLAGK